MIQMPRNMFYFCVSHFQSFVFQDEFLCENEANIYLGPFKVFSKHLYFNKH